MAGTPIGRSGFLPLDPPAPPPDIGAMSRAVLTMESPLPARRPPLAPGEDPGTPLTLVSDYEPAGDQPKALAELVAGLKGGERDQVLLGVTGSGQQFTVAHAVHQLGRPAPVLAPHKTLAATPNHERKTCFHP